MKMTAVTQWFSCKPTRVGVYQTYYDGPSYCPDRVKPLYQYWNGHFWGLRAFDAESARLCGGIQSGHQSCPWRGLARKP